MAQRSWILTDVDAGGYLEQISIGPDEVGGPARGYRICKRRLRGGLCDGVDVVEIDNGKLSLVVVPTRGMGIWKASVRDMAIGWSSPIRGPVHPQWVPLMEPSGLGWLDGFDELLVRCGLESNGAPDFDSQGLLKYPLHGRIANRPAHRVTVAVDGESGQMEITGIVEETRIHFSKLRLTSTLRIRIGETAFRIHDEVTNLSGTPAEMQLLYHANFGVPLLEPASRLVAAVQAMAPRDARAAEGIGDWSRYVPPQPGSQEQVYFFRLLGDGKNKTQVVLKNASSRLGVGLDFSTAQLPCFTLWKNTAAEEDGYVTGLEPGTNFPNPRSYETRQGRFVSLAPGERASFDIGLTVYSTAAEVAAAEAAVEKLQSRASPQIFQQPQAGWSPSGG